MKDCTYGESSFKERTIYVQRMGPRLNKERWLHVCPLRSLATSPIGWLSGMSLCALCHSVRYKEGYMQRTKQIDKGRCPAGVPDDRQTSAIRDMPGFSIEFILWVLRVLGKNSNN